MIEKYEFESSFFPSEKRVHRKKTPQTGWGIFAVHPFKKGEVLFNLELRDTENARMLTFEQSFGECYDYGVSFVPEFVFCPQTSHPFKSLNHSCNANSGFIHWGMITGDTVSIVAYRDIEPEEQVTLDYALLTTVYDGTLSGEPWKMDCLCGASNCRGMISDFTTLPHDEQMKFLLEDHPRLYGQIIAHMLADMGSLPELLKSEAPKLHEAYLIALQSQKDYTRQRKVTAVG